MKRFLKTVLSIIIILTLCIMIAFIVNLLPINTSEKNVFYNLKVYDDELVIIDLTGDDINVIDNEDYLDVTSYEGGILKFAYHIPKNNKNLSYKLEELN